MLDRDKHIKEVLARFGEDFETNTWQLPGGKSRAILHPCVERMAAKAGIRFEQPDIVSAAPDNVVIIVTGYMGDASIWSFGEASPRNNKNAYVFSMAEKRGKGRVALKLLGLHGLLHDETETFVEDDKPARRERPAGNGEVKSSAAAKREGVWPQIEAGIAGCKDSEALLAWAATVQGGLSAKWQEQSQEAWGNALADKLADECHTPSETRQWGVVHAKSIEAMPMEWISTARAVCTEHIKALRVAADKAALEAAHV